MTQTASAFDCTPGVRALYTAFDMGRDSWQFAASDGGKTRRELKISRADLDQGSVRCRRRSGALPQVQH